MSDHEEHQAIRDEARKERERQQSSLRAQEIRAQALGLAAQLYSVPSIDILLLPANVFDLADRITTYIVDGVKP